MPSSINELRARLPELMLRDERRLRRRLDDVRKLRDEAARTRTLGKITTEVESAERRVQRRRAAMPEVTYPESLPVSGRRDEIAAAIRDHQVVIVAGETGSGKTTQLPKVCLELGRGVRGLIGHTQPRRLAARTVADRIASELKTEPGGVVGYKMRFTDSVGEDTLVKLMTDGILLAEIQSDRMLRQYDTIIIDEAHERSLNVDFLLGYLKQLLPRRPDLKVIITSATIDPERFSRHFGDAPIIEVSGRTYPVEVRYRPVADDSEDRDQVQAIADAVDELGREGPGDILVFLSGEREIRDTAEYLRRHEQSRKQGARAEILPLYARLSSAEQHRVFQAHSGRRIVLATNVAETSLTVPGIRYVIDPGTARISRYSTRTKVQRLPIEPVSQASANQRKGRCGRVAAGICVRLYSEEDFEARPEFTDPEILRTNLASVILQMTALDLGDIAAFPFVEPPDRRAITDGVRLLEELGAIEPGVAGRLTPMGRKLAQLPVDPRLARMVVEAERNGCLRDVLVIVAALSIQDPRERPAEKRQAADERHARFADPESDFHAFLKLWAYLRERQRELSGSQFRKLCRTEYLSWLRIREWQDLDSQLRQVCRGMGMHLGDAVGDAPAGRLKVTLSLLAGLLSHIGRKDGDKNEYGGARGTRFAIFPGSGLFKKPPKWVMAAELVETSRLWARMAARIEPDWVEPLAAHLVQRTYSEPRWDRARGEVVASERVTLYGITLVADRTVSYGRIDPPTARELFIRHALVEGEWDTSHPFMAANRRLLEEVEDLEERARRRDIVVDDEELFEFYDQRVGPDVVSARHFDAWWKPARAATPDLLDFEQSMLIKPGAAGVSKADYPDTWTQGELRLRLTYQFEPGAEADGVTVHVPIAVLNQLTGDDFDWQVPGLREELVTALIRSLPKALRRNFVPAPNFARDVLARLADDGAVTGWPLLDALEDELRRMTGVVIGRDDWNLDAVPPHLRMTFRVVEKRRTLGEDKDLDALKARLKGRMRAAISAAADDGIQQRGLVSWTIGTLPREIEQQRGGRTVRAYPALVDEGSSVAVGLLEDETAQRVAMAAGTRRLLLLGTASPVKWVLGRLPNDVKLTLSQYRYASAAELFDDCVAAAADRLVAEHGGPAWDEAGFRKLYDAVRGDLHDATLDVVLKVARALAVAAEVRERLDEPPTAAVEAAWADMRTQLVELVAPGFVTAAGAGRLPDLLRYLRGMQLRLDRLPQGARRDEEIMWRVQDLRDQWLELRDRVPPGRPPGEALDEIRWMLEELRVGLFAQTLGTPRPISEKRILRAMDAVAV
jgi:ATP-dependent helicase HrpA